MFLSYVSYDTLVTCTSTTTSQDASCYLHPAPSFDAHFLFPSRPHWNEFYYCSCDEKLHLRYWYGSSCISPAATTPTLLDTTVVVTSSYTRVPCSFWLFSNITGNQSQQDLRYRQTPRYFPIFTNNEWSYLSPPVTINSTGSSYEDSSTRGIIVRYEAARQLLLFPHVACGRVIGTDPHIPVTR